MLIFYVLTFGNQAAADINANLEKSNVHKGMSHALFHWRLTHLRPKQLYYRIFLDEGLCSTVIAF